MGAANVHFSASIGKMKVCYFFEVVLYFYSGSPKRSALHDVMMEYILWRMDRNSFYSFSQLSGSPWSLATIKTLSQMKLFVRILGRSKLRHGIWGNYLWQDDQILNLKLALIFPCSMNLFALRSSCGNVHLILQQTWSMLRATDQLSIRRENFIYKLERLYESLPFSMER